MKTLPVGIITQKSKIATPGAWLTCIDIAYPNLTTSPRTHYKFVNNTENVVIPGSEPLADRTYSKRAFGLGQVKESIKGELPRVVLSLYDVNLTMRSALQDNDGWSGGEVSVRRVYVSLAGVVTDTGILQYFTILSTTWDDSSNTINFNIGVSTPLSKRFPRDRYVSTVCRHKFRDGFCRYGETGADGDVTTVYTEFVPKGEYAGNPNHAYIAVGVAEAYTDFVAGQYIRISGSANNDNEYKIESITEDALAAAYLNLDTVHDLVYESNWPGANIRIYTTCNHSLTQCRVHNNSHKYGASPGVSEGLYG